MEFRGQGFSLVLTEELGPWGACIPAHFTFALVWSGPKQAECGRVLGVHGEMRREGGEGPALSGESA